MPSEVLVWACGLVFNPRHGQPHDDYPLVRANPGMCLVLQGRWRQASGCRRGATRYCGFFFMHTIIIAHHQTNGFTNISGMALIYSSMAD
jgi:hypothetical protein